MVIGIDSAEAKGERNLSKIKRSDVKWVVVVDIQIKDMLGKVH